MPGLGVPEEMVGKNLVVEDSGNKSYQKIGVAVVLMLACYFTMTWGYKMYKKWKNKQYAEFDDDEDENEQKKINNKG